MRRQADLLDGPILPTLARLALPIMATYLLEMAYNMVDMIWIGRVGSEAAAAVGAAGMYLWLSNGLSILARTGGQVKVGHSLGEGKPQEAAVYGRCAIWMGIFLGIGCGAAFVLFRRPLIAFFGLSGSEAIRGAEGYLALTGGCVLFSFLTSILTGLFMAMGNSAVSLRANSVGLIVNMAMDPVLIFGPGPFPRMGIVGAALATVLAQAVTAALMGIAVLRFGGLFRMFHLSEGPSWRHVGVMIRVAAPLAVQNMAFSGISMVIARLVAGWGDAAVAVQKVGSQIESISWMTADGFSAALSAFTAQNYGAGKMGRVRKGYGTAMAVTVLWGIFCTLLLVLLPGPIFRIFIPDPAVAPLGADYLRILGLSQLFMCMEITTQGAFSGIGRTIPPSVEGIALTAMRIPLAMLLSATALGLDGIWWSISLSSVAKGVVLTVWFLFALRGLSRQGRKSEG